MSLNRIVCIFLAVVFGAVSAQARRHEEASPDLSILEQRAELSRFLTLSQRQQLNEADRAITRAESDIERGNYMATRKPSKLKPDEDLRSIHKEGEAIVNAGQLQLHQAQLQIIEVLTAAQGQKAQAIANLRKTYSIRLESMPFGEALQAAAGETLQACRELGYERILFDGTFVTQNEKSATTDAALRNTVYDALVEAGSAGCSVSMPVNLRYDSAADDDHIRFRYDGEAALGDRKVALLRSEILASGTSDEGCLVMEAFDIKTRQVLKRQTYRLTDLAEILGHDAMLGDPTATFPQSVELIDEKSTLATLDGLGANYHFSIEVDAVEDQALSLVYEDLLAQLIQDHTSIPLYETHFIERAYGREPDAAAHLAEVKTVSLRLDSDDSGYCLRAQASGQPRVLEVGSVVFTTPAADLPESEVAAQ